ncbi:hypothetical protein HK104_003088, partial [Borealophlyctis nickersoniae]
MQKRVLSLAHARFSSVPALDQNAASNGDKAEVSAAGERNRGSHPFAGHDRSRSDTALLSRHHPSSVRPGVFDPPGHRHLSITTGRTRPVAIPAASTLPTIGSQGDVKITHASPVKDNLEQSEASMDFPKYSFPAQEITTPTRPFSPWSRHSLLSIPSSTSSTPESPEQPGETMRMMGLTGHDTHAARPYPFRNPYQSTSSNELFGSLVGSYEESILSGRMSTLPSKPITFIVEIGVVAFGKCKAALKCPPHAQGNFSAFFYELEDDESPATPYVGNIEVDECVVADNEGGGDGESGGARCKEVGGYRLPPKGQLQVIIKNPSRTAIKVFLIPYDFRDMPPGTKTFLRQKSYA